MTFNKPEDFNTYFPLLVNGDEAAFRWFLKAYGQKMLILAQRYLRDLNESEDCIQKSCVTIYQKLSSLKNKDAFWGWVKKIVINHALMILRKRTAQKTDLLSDIGSDFDDTGHRIEDKLICDNPTPEEIYSKMENIEYIRKAISNLPDGYKTILQLRDIDEYTTRETADLLMISEQNVKTKLHRARSLLRLNLLTDTAREHQYEKL